MNAYAQTLAPVAASTSTFDPWVFGAILLAVVVVVCFVYLKHKAPATAATLTTTAGAELKTVGGDILTELGKMRAALEAHLAATAPPAGATGATGPAAPAAAPTPTPEQLAAVASAQAALDAAKKAAGVA